MITDLEQYQNDVKDLPNLLDVRYENIFKVAKSDKLKKYLSQMTYNLIYILNYELIVVCHGLL